MRVGIGFDIHRLEDGGGVILGGVRIPFEGALIGHSDADVLLHAICDAMLGAAGEGDIGVHFPNTDPRLKGISSIELLKKTNKIIGDKGYRVSNIDSRSIPADRPHRLQYPRPSRWRRSPHPLWP